MPPLPRVRRQLLVILLLVWVAGAARGAEFAVGPGKELTSLAEVPWEKLAPGDVVAIHWRAEP